MASTSEELEAIWDRLGVSVDALEIADDGTIAPTIPASPPGETTASTSDSLELGEVIGSGGMGLVYAGRQVGLDRAVAIKSIKPGQPAALARQLLHEARVTGALEHPSIVPVYAIGSDADDRPLIVMKLVTGEAWLERIDRRESGEPVDLERELEVLEHVCNAVAFAHERRVLHRDIKPANVLLGDFGEVYLVDWGLAADLGGAGIDGLPLAADVEEVAGTLPYMAPEQLAGSGETFGPATDVFLLGATLYEVLAGRPIREFKSGKLRELLVRAFTEAPPPLPEWVPPELVGICERALEPRPDDRFPSALAMRDALVRFRNHRVGRELIAEAEAELATALAWIEAGGKDESVDRRLAAARFGFDQALRNWPESPGARDGLDRALVIAAERELAARRPDSARALLRSLTGDDAVLRERIETLRERIAEELERADALERAARESDLGQAARLRRRFGMGFGLCMLFLHLGAGILDRAQAIELTFPIYLAMTSALAFVFALPVAVMHRRVLPNQANMLFVLTLGIMLLAQVGVFCGMWAAGVSLEMALAISLIQLAGSIAIKTALLDRRVMWTAAVSLALGVIAAARPAVAVELVGFAYASYFIGGALLSFDSSVGRVLIEDVSRRSGSRDRRRPRTTT